MENRARKILQEYLRHDEQAMRAYERDDILGLSAYYIRYSPVYQLVRKHGPRFVESVAETPSIVAIMDAGLKFAVGMFGYASGEPMKVNGQDTLRTKRHFDKVGFTPFLKKDGYFDKSEIIGTTVAGIQDINDTSKSYNLFVTALKSLLNERKIDGFIYMVYEDRLWNPDILAVKRPPHLEGEVNTHPHLHLSGPELPLDLNFNKVKKSTNKK